MGVNSSGCHQPACMTGIFGARAALSWRLYILSELSSGGSISCGIEYRVAAWENLGIQREKFIGNVKPLHVRPPLFIAAN